MQKYLDQDCQQYVMHVWVPTARNVVCSMRLTAVRVPLPPVSLPKAVLVSWTHIITHAMGLNYGTRTGATPSTQSLKSTHINHT